MNPRLLVFVWCTRLLGGANALCRFIVIHPALEHASASCRERFATRAYAEASTPTIHGKFDC